jgi:hypothetical protein
VRSPTLNEKATYHGIRDQPSSPPLSCHCRHNHCCCSARHGRLRERTGRHSKPDTAAHDQAGTNTSFASLKQIDAGVLNVGYAEAGPADSPVVILLHGWPYDIHSYVDVAPLLASAGYGVIVPYRRGYGSTRFLSSDTFRNGQQSVLAVDIIALMDALKIRRPRSPALIGERERPTSSRRSGRSAARPWSP